MKRYNAVQGGVYDNSVMVEEKDGDWVWYEDVEAQCAELETKCAELLEASEAIVARWDRWKDQPHTPAGVFIDQLRSAIAEAKGEVMP